MKAIVATGYGDSQKLVFQDVAVPDIKNDEVLVMVNACSATRADTMMLQGRPYFSRLFTGITRPRHPVPGTGFAGEVVATGEKVTRFLPGDKVFGETTLSFGANAEYVAVSENGVILHKPDFLSFEDAAPICDGFLTSIFFLKELAQIKKGQNVLIIGASGSLGTAAVQLAKCFGAEVTGVCSNVNTNLVLSLGADRVMDYNRQDIAQSGHRYDIIFDTVGKHSYSSTRQILKVNGMYLTPVFGASLLPDMFRTAMTGRKKVKFAATGLKSAPVLRRLLSDLLLLFSLGKIKTVIHKQYPLENLADAHQCITQGHKKGNMVIINRQKEKNDGNEIS